MLLKEQIKTTNKTNMYRNLSSGQASNAAAEIGQDANHIRLITETKRTSFARSVIGQKQDVAK